MIRNTDNTKQKMKILVVEDDVYQRLALIDILTLNDYEVTAVENGKLARDQLLNQNNKFNLILSDLAMPEMNGYELLCLIKSDDKFKNIPVIIMSSDKQIQIVSDCINQGAVDYIIKPIRLQDVKCFQKYLLINHNNNQQHIVKINDYHKIKQIHKGSEDSIDLVKRNTDNQYFILKVIPMHFMSKNEKKQIQNEISILKVLDGPTIIKYYENFIENNSIQIIMEYLERGTLSDLIREYESRRQYLNGEQILCLISQVILAIMIIHSNNIIHRNIRPQNIFVSSDHFIKLGKSRISKELGTQNQLAKTFQETPYSMAPEICEGSTYSYKADIWAIGCVLYEMVTYKRPFQANQLQEVFTKIINQQPDALPPNTHNDIQLLVQLMLHKNPNDRPSIWKLAEIPIIKNNIYKFVQDHDFKSVIDNLYSNIGSYDHQSQQSIQKVKKQQN